MYRRNCVIYVFLSFTYMCWKGEFVQLKWRWFWWCPRLCIMCITGLGLVLIF